MWIMCVDHDIHTASQYIKHYRAFIRHCITNAILVYEFAKRIKVNKKCIRKKYKVNLKM